MRLTGLYSPVLTWLKYHPFARRQWKSVDWAIVKGWALPLVEASSVVLFAIWVGRAYLDNNPNHWPYGPDFSLNVQGYFAWQTVRQCGLCVLWNGSLNGGAPLFAELLAAIAHPLVVLFVLLAGVISGLKLTIVAALAIAGLAQWWMARVLRLGWAARLWSAAMAVVGGHLAGRMENGLVEVAFSAAACSLVMPAILYLSQRGNRRAIALLGVVLALALLSGQGYMQLGLLLSVVPMTALLLVDRKLQPRPIWTAFAAAGVIALLLTAYYWVPLLNFYPQIAKPTDPTFSTAQPLAYLPLNLVINDYSFFVAQSLGMLPWPHLYTNYIGWVPVLLAMLSLRLIPGGGRRPMVFLLGTIFLVYLAASAMTLRAIQLLDLGPLTSWAVGARFPSEISSLAVPPILALGAWAVDYLVAMSWPRLALSVPSGKVIGVSLAWLVVGVPLVLAVRSAYLFGHEWLKTADLPPDYLSVIPQVKPSTATWVQGPYSDWNFVDYALASGMKITNTYRPWTWQQQVLPPPALTITRDAIDPSTIGYRGQVGFAYLTDHPENAYASVQIGTQRVPCTASAVGGNIDVQCQTAADGQLTVNENLWSGWSVTRDGIGASLGQGPSLTTDAPAGTHVYRFRYRPWDVALGLLLTLAGLIWLARLIFMPAKLPATSGI